MKMKKIYVFVLGLFLSGAVFSQEKPVIPAIRLLHHEYILQSLDTIAGLRNRDGSLFAITTNKDLNKTIDSSVRLVVNRMRNEIELNDKLDENARFKWLRGINEMLTGFIRAYRLRTITATQLPSLVKAYADAMHADWKGESFLDMVAENEPETGKILIDNYALKNNKGINEAKDLIVLKLCQRKPGNVLAILARYPESKYADSLIIIAAYRNQS